MKADVKTYYLFNLIKIYQIIDNDFDTFRQIRYYLCGLIIFSKVISKEEFK